jgi:hypothetical protein
VNPRHWPLSFIVFTILGTACLILAVAALTGIGARLHPLLADEGAAIAMVVTAVALFLTGAFPLVLRGLAEREGA